MSLDFAERLPLAIPHFDGVVLVLEGFFDDTILQPSPLTIGVGGFLFGVDGLQQFTKAWAPRVKDLPAPFRTAACFNNGPPFDTWEPEDCAQLLRDLALLIADTRDAGFTATVEQSEYDSFRACHPNLAMVAGSPFTIALMACFNSVRSYMDANYAHDEVFLWIEAGSKNQAEAEEFIGRLYRNTTLRESYRLGGWAFVPKTKALALCAADFLAWEWQRNYRELVNSGDDELAWRQNFQLLFRADSKPIYPNPLWRTRMGIMALVSRFYSLHRD